MSASTPLQLDVAPTGRSLAEEDSRVWRRGFERLFAIFSLSSLRFRLIAIVFAIDCLATVLSGSVAILKARLSTKAEIASSMQLAEMSVVETLNLLEHSSEPETVQGKVRQLNSIRHVKIVAMIDGADETVETALAPLHTKAATHSHVDQAPGWFKNLVATPIESRTFPVTVRGQPIGSVTILSEPADEIDESWDYALGLLEATLFANVIALAALFLFFGKALTPLKSLAEGLIDLEGKDYSVRLTSPSVREFAIITKHFNLTAEALAVAQAANHALNRNLVDAQDRERRRIALELHDEMGPCLFALEANATSIAHMTKDLSNGERIHERALDVMQLVERIQSVNRRMLDSLRPIALGHMPLGKCLENLLFDLAPNDSGAAVDSKIGVLQASYGVRIDLTLYRCVQEGLCNALRHAQASRIVVILDEISDPRGALISLRIEDDGIGLRFPVPSGTGLSGMRERVEALDGSFDLRSSPKGTILAILLPLEAEVPLAPVLRNSAS